MARIYIELYSSLLIHKVVDGDEGRIYSLSSAAEAETKRSPSPPCPPLLSLLSHTRHERSRNDGNWRFVF